MGYLDGLTRGSCHSAIVLAQGVIQFISKGMKGMDSIGQVDTGIAKDQDFDIFQSVGAFASRCACAR